MTAEEWKRYAAAQLVLSGDEDAETDTRLFLCAVLGCEPDQLRFRYKDELAEENLEQLSDMLSRRLTGEPEQYIEGCAWFMGLKFKCDFRALIPRQDTETLCEFALEWLKKRACANVLDMCTGSGILAVAIKHYCPNASVTASDISVKALELAQENAKNLKTDVRFVHSDGFQELQDESFDLIVCNPPYLSRSDMEEIPETVRHEPETALYGGLDGLEFYRKIAPLLASHLLPHGCAAFEVGEGQAESVSLLFKCALPNAAVEKKQDLNHIERIVIVRT